MTLTDSNLRYLLAIHHLAQQSTEVSPLALAQAMGVTKPSVTSILTSLMKQGVIVRRRYGKIYITDRGVLYARYYDELVEKILQHFPLAGEGFTPRNATAPRWPWPCRCPQGRLTRSAKRCTTTRTSKPTGLHVGRTCAALRLSIDARLPHTQGPGMPGPYRTA